MSDPLSFSMMVDHSRNGNIGKDKSKKTTSIESKTRYKWLEDKCAVGCMNCDKEFWNYWITRRRHHCRGCGYIFCGTCTKYKAYIPKCVDKIPLKLDGTKIDRSKRVRLCRMCFHKFEMLHALDVLITVSIRGGITIKDIKNIGQVCKSWNKFANFQLSRFREIQYKLPHQKYSDWEIGMLWNNKNLFVNHNIWQTHLIKSVFQSNTNEKIEYIKRYFKSECMNKTNCWNLMCTRNCKTELSIQNTLTILRSGVYDNEILEMGLKSFKKCDDTLFENYIPFLLNWCLNFKFDKRGVVWNLILEKCKTNIRIANCVYWQLQISQKAISEFIQKQSKTFLKNLFENISSDFKSIISSCQKFSDTIEEFYDSDDPLDIVRALGELNKSVLPTHPEYGTVKIRSSFISIKQSMTKPIVIPVKTIPLKNQLESKKPFKLKILRKCEDIRKDMHVIHVIRLMEYQLKSELNIDFEIITYNTQPTDINSGFIEMVDDCVTLYEIQEKLQKTILNYISDKNPDVVISELRSKFLKSCAAYCVISFILGIGDRHLENIMLTSKGNLFHIDYGFVLGQDPKPMKIPFIRMTQDMIDAIGGMNTKRWNEFKHLCNTIYNVLRRNVSEYMCLLELLVTTDPIIDHAYPMDLEKLHEQIIKTFSPSDTYQEAKILLASKIENSTNMGNSIRYRLIDFFHRHNKEQTIKNVLSASVNIGVKGTKQFVTGVWDYMTMKQCE